MNLKEWWKRLKGMETKKKFIAGTLAVVIIIGSVGGGVFAYNSRNSNAGIESTAKKEVEKKKEVVDYKTCVTGMRDWKVEVGTEKVDYMDSVKYDKKYVTKVTADDSKVKLTVEGTYELVYKIEAIDKSVDSIKKQVTVAVMTKEQAQAEAAKGAEVVTKEGVQNKAKAEAPVPKTESGKVATGDNSKTNSNSGSSQAKADAPSKPTNSGGGNKPSAPEKPSAPTHTHSWNAVNHPAEGYNETYTIRDAYTTGGEPIYEQQERSICNTCGADITGATAPHMKSHMMNGENGSYRGEWVNVQVGTSPVVNHPAETGSRWVQTKNAWTSYSCGCGATK